jgi:hypothetical protein
MKIAARHPVCTACRLVGAAWAALALSSVLAQSPPPRPAAVPGTAASAPDAAGGERTTERIRTEDAGSRIDELRVGGETQQITVQPKTDVPAYEVNPAEGARGSAPSNRNNDTNGSRVWNLFRF